MDFLNKGLTSFFVFSTLDIVTEKGLNSSFIAFSYSGQRPDLGKKFSYLFGKKEILRQGNKN